ncbi:hypothetical protein GS429_13670 [Natronorubrum sp. JWXQ-INN-674]|uniref:DUF8107 domain-containing protein n=1 Tax=Natronorubrum halalkaliphilum TaxID=2691917 RepID=A0A6B0VPN4_9EURY|nr:hypothetical protein [Natronorubrum halalkaliphilum]MXV63097.1 hypothetical protein [Natronorubrum halalkaliphilum]
MSEGDSNGFSEGVASSQGDVRVLVAMNAVLSTLFAWSIVWGLSFLGMVEFGVINVATAAIVLFAMTYLVTMT